jgi:hypothetical protein
MNDPNTYYTIEPCKGGYWIVQHGLYEMTSVLAGQPFRQLCKFYENLDLAKADYPEAEVLEYQTPRPEVYIPQEPPSWFDPLDAGEVWHENDY